VLGENRVFPVDFDKIKTVGYLKQKIEKYKENNFDSTDFKL